jgi:uncharacterized repeat protein (TIGR01451 family)
MIECRNLIAIPIKKYCFLIMNKLFLTVTTVLILSFSGAAFASEGSNGYGTPCEPVYGGGEVCVSKGQILINKTVKNPQSGAFVDNLSLSNDPKYSADQTVEFQLTLTNTGKETLNDVTVTDTFPSFITFESGNGTFDSNSKTLTFKVTDLKAGESRIFVVKGKVVSISSLPSDQAVTCVVNQVKAKSSENESSDVSQFCIEKVITTTKGGLPVMPAPVITQTPSTGAESLALIGLIPAAVGGLFLRRRSR